MSVHASGHLDTGHHKIYYEDWGSRDTTPIFSLHGGPGGGFSDRHKDLFDPEQHRVIFHDQRGCGQSTPYADTTENTTQDLIADIERLREHFGFEQIYVTGGSWGSALSLFYTLAHPERIKAFVIWSVFAGRQFEVDFVNEGYPHYYFPDAYERFISLVPESERTNGDSIMRYYSEKIHGENEEEAYRFAFEWTVWEYTLCSILYDKEALEQEVAEDPNLLAVARLETHYFLNKCFVPENHVFDSLDRIKHIPLTIVQGRFDMCTPPVTAANLRDTYGEHLTLKWVNSGHLTTDPEMFAALKQTMVEVFV